MRRKCVASQGLLCFASVDLFLLLFPIFPTVACVILRIASQHQSTLASHRDSFYTSSHHSPTSRSARSASSHPRGPGHADPPHPYRPAQHEQILTSDFVQGQITQHNSRFAVRITDLIDISVRRRPCIKGRGSHKRWVPSAVQRLCFGRGWQKPKRTVCGIKAHRVRSPFASSIRGAADFYRASTSHIQNMRSRGVASSYGFRLQR